MFFGGRYFDFEGATVGYFVWDAASQSIKRQDMLEILEKACVYGCDCDICQ